MVKLGFVEDEVIAAILSRQYGVSFIDLYKVEIDPQVLKKVPVAIDVGRPFGLADDLDGSASGLFELLDRLAVERRWGVLGLFVPDARPLDMESAETL